MDEFGYLIKEAEVKFFDELTKEASVGTISARAMGRVGELVAKKAKRVSERAFPKTVKDPRPTAKQMTQSQKDVLRAGTSAERTRGGMSEKEWEKARQYAEGMGISLGHGGTKLARLVKESSQHGLQKEAAEALAGDVPESFEKLASTIAAASSWDIGMMDTAIDYIGTLEKLGVDQDDAGKLSDYLIGQALSTDATIHAVMEKQAGDERSLEAIRNEFIKVAIIGALGRVSSRLAGGIGKIWSRGVGKIQGTRAKWARGTESAHRGAAGKAGKEIAALKRAIPTAPLAQRVSLGRQLKHKEAYQAKRLAKAEHYGGKAGRIEQAAGVRPKPMPKPEPVPSPKGTQTAPSQPTTAPPPKTPAGEKPPTGKETTGAGGKTTSPPKNTEKALEEVAKKDQGLYSKWKEGGWDALTDIEKRRVYTYAAGAFVGQRAVMDKPIV